MHVVNTICTIIPEVTDKKVALLSYGLWILFLDGEGVVPAGLAFVLCMARPANMRGSSRTCVGVKYFPERDATLSRGSLWRAVNRSPFLQLMAWKMDNAALQTSQNLVGTGALGHICRNRASRYSCAPSSVSFTVNGCNISHDPVFVTRRKRQGHSSGSPPVPLLTALYTASATFLSPPW